MLTPRDMQGPQERALDLCESEVGDLDTFVANSLEYTPEEYVIPEKIERGYVDAVIHKQADVTMSDIQFIPHTQIARILGTSEGTVRFRPFNAQRVALLALLAGCAAFSTALAQEEPVGTVFSAVRSVFEQSRNAVVRVEWVGSQGVIKGTGFYIDPIGTIYTFAVHAENSQKVEVIQDGVRHPATVLLSDPYSGIAILRSEPGKGFLRPAKDESLKIANPVVLVGFPLDLDLSPGFGIVAGFDKCIVNHFFLTTHLRVNIPILHGQGGSPILNMSGEVVGIATSRVHGEACHALPISAAEKIRQNLARFGEVRPGWLGLVVGNEEVPKDGSRVRIVLIDPRGPAHAAGIRSGDVILRIGSTPIHVCEDVIDPCFFLTAGEMTEIEVLRDSQKLLFQAEPTLHPSIQKPSFAGMDFTSVNTSFPAPSTLLDFFPPPEE